jgi:hypothetical protein
VNTSVVKIGTQKEAINQMMMVDKALGDVISELQDLNDEKKQIWGKLKATKEMARLKEISKRTHVLTVAQHETIGQRKLIIRFLEKLGVKLPQTNLTKLIEKDGEVRAMVEVK